MGRAKVAGVAFAALLLAGCLQKELSIEEKRLVEELKTQLASIHKEIQSAQAEDEELEGGLVKALIGARLEILKTNQALVEQRIHAVESGAPVKQVTNVTSSDPELVAKLEGELVTAKATFLASQKEAQRYDGLVGAMVSARAATEGQTVAMLEQKLLSAKYGLVSPALQATQQDDSSESSYPSTGIPRLEVELCAGMSELRVRNTCYEHLAERHGLNVKADESAEPEAATGNWVVSQRTDPLTDEVIHSAMLIAESGSSRFGGAPVLMVRCQNNATEMFINWKDYLGRDAYTTYRVGQEKAITSNWSLSTDSKAAFFPGSPVPTLKKMLESTSFVANITPYNESPVTAIFDTTGAAEAFVGIRTACNW